MGIWIAVAVILFALGSIMALKPSGVERRLDDVRMTARRLGLNPKLIATPEWLKPASEFQATSTSPMIARYSLIDDGYALPDCQYKVINGRLRPVQNNDAFISNQAFILNNAHLDLPSAIASQILGISTQANSISVYWLDNNYVKPAHNANYAQSQIEPDLLALKEALIGCAEKLVNVK